MAVVDQEKLELNVRGRRVGQENWCFFV